MQLVDFHAILTKKEAIQLKTKNICRFPTAALDSKPLSILCFVRETDAEIMRTPFSLPTNRMLLVSEGSGRLFCDGASYPLHSGTLAFCFAGETVTAEGDGLVYMYIDYEGTRSEELLRRFDITPFSRIFEGMDGLIPLWQENLFRSSEGTVDLAAESILLFGFSRLSDSHDAEGGTVAQIVELTEEEFRDPDLCIAKIAEWLSYHPKYLSHLFKKRTGVGYSEYLRSVRIRYAVSLFDRGLYSIKNVALLSGFSDPLYFSSTFKKAIGISPKEFILKQMDTIET